MWPILCFLVENWDVRKITHTGLVHRQAETLRQIEAYHSSMKQEIAVTRRATYKAEEAIQQLEKDKGQQDSLIDKLQETLKGLHQQAALLDAQVWFQCGLCWMCHGSAV